MSNNYQDYFQLFKPQYNKQNSAKTEMLHLQKAKFSPSIRGQRVKVDAKILCFQKSLKLIFYSCTYIEHTDQFHKNVLFMY